MFKADVLAVVGLPLIPPVLNENIDVVLWEDLIKQTFLTSVSDCIVPRQHFHGHPM